jgi:putative two-component system response regulator
MVPEFDTPYSYTLSHRSYRPSLGIDFALEEIMKSKKTLYDETVVDAHLRLFREKGFQLEGA